MIRMLHSAAGLAAVVLAAGAAFAQPAPNEPSQAPREQTLNPYETPRELQAGDGVANPQGMDEAHKGVRDRGVDRTAKKARATAAAPSDLVVGAQISDSRGKPVGTVQTVEIYGAVVATGAGQVKVPLEAFGKNRKGLVLSITKAEFDAAVASAVQGK